ncbi:MAG: hypothetical protein JKY37_33290 [Nannocystaceae bacterium]|nr:hypothetical protein [Nannocystaceae bacterium]
MDHEDVFAREDVNASDSSAPTHDQPDNSVRPQTPAEALAADNPQLAAELDVSVQDVKRAVRFHESFADFLDWVILRNPGKIAGAWVDPVPAVAGHIRFVGPVPREVLGELARRDDIEPQSVSFTVDGRISSDDQARRAEFVVLALVEAGYPNSSAGFDPVANQIRVRVHVPNAAAVDAQQLQLDDLLTWTEKKLAESHDLSGRSKELSPRDLRLATTVSPDSLLELEHSYGGAVLRDDGVFECTSGWAVEGPDGDGIITAAHCIGLNQYDPPGSASAYSISWRDQTLGLNGDVEYHTTSHIEQPRFYASAGVLRYTTSIRSTATMVGQSVCVYGRASNVRTCDHTVLLVNETVGIQHPDGSFTVTGSLAEATNASTQFGDSGGGWSYGTRAFGTHVGQGGGLSYFTPVEVAEDQLAVTILTN